MTPKRDLFSRIRFFTAMTLFWTAVWLFFMLLRQWGIDEFRYVSFTEDPNRSAHVLIHLGLGALTGIFHGSSELLFERSAFAKRSYGELISIKTAVYFLIAIVLMIAAVLSFQIIETGGMDPPKVVDWIVSRNFFLGLIYFLSVTVLVSFAREVNYKFGPGVLWNMIAGKYHQPRQEERIFMFLDMKSSTTIAERLGHIRFSRLLQDCFNDLTQVILTHRADIYQYVGDEVILCWQLKEGLIDGRCVRCYFDFSELLRNRADHYRKEFGVEPYFKAGIHVGKVTVAEVGVVKRDIAYHGDVLNTAARIQGRCNELGQGLLVSGTLVSMLKISSEFSGREIGLERLRGKEEVIQLFGIEKRTAVAG